MVLVVAAGAMSTGCWGDYVPSLDQVGALRTEGGEVTILFGACPGDAVQAVVLNLADDNFEEILGVLWAIEVDDGGSAEEAFTVGQTPPGFREVIALDEALKPGHHVQLVVTSTKWGPIPMSFEIGGLRTDEVRVHRPGYLSRAAFDERISAVCDDGAVSSVDFGIARAYLVVGLAMLVVLGPLAFLIGRDANRHGRNGWGWGLFFFFQPIIGGVAYLIVRRKHREPVS